MHPLAILLSFLAVVVAQNSTNSTYDVLSFVNQLIGSSNGGNVFPGATLPYGMPSRLCLVLLKLADSHQGMAKAVADTNSGSNQGGFTTDGSAVTGMLLCS